MAISEPSRKKGVAYYRHSAKDKQENSVLIQREHTQKFTNAHQVEIIHEEADDGESGLSADRPGFKRLFKDWIENIDAPSFDYVFVYDVSRWGRFQDSDEAGHFEYICKQNARKLYMSRKGFLKKKSS
jgi:DNA invertase Pin-like site-specific DNA recombinase